MFSSFLIPAIVILSGMILSVVTRKLTLAAASIGGLIAILVYLGSGLIGVGMMAAFFIVGTLATTWKRIQKVAAGLEERNKGRREAVQVLANAGVAGLLGGAVCWFPDHQEVLQLMIAASFASAAADTLASELGNIYGTRYFNIITFKPERRGLDGVVSLEGTLFGFAGSALIAFVFAFSSVSTTTILIVFISGAIGNLFDSLLGASLQRKSFLNNDAVNFFNTLFAALVSAFLLHLYV